MRYRCPYLELYQLMQAKRPRRRLELRSHLAVRQAECIPVLQPSSRPDLLPCNARRRAHINWRAPVLEHGHELVAQRPFAHDGRVQSEVQVSDRCDAQLTRSLGANINPIHPELLHGNPRPVFRDIEHRDTVVPAPIRPRIARRRLRRSDALQAPQRLADDIRVDVEVEGAAAVRPVVGEDGEADVEVGHEPEVAGVVVPQTAALGPDVDDGRDGGAAGAVDLPGPADAVAQVGGVDAVAEPAAGDGGREEAGA